MIALSIILGVACAILLVLLSSQDNKNTKLAVENSLLKGRMEGLQEKLAQQAPDADEPLTAEGIAEAVKEGKYKGGQVKRIDDKTFDKYYQQYKTRAINKVQFAKALNISRPTLDKLLKEKKSADIIK